MRKFSLATLLAFVGLMAIELAALRYASEALADLALQATYLALALATLAAVPRRGRGGAWAGFAVFGGAFFVPVHAFENGLVLSRLPSTRWLREAAIAINPAPAAPPGYTLIRDEGWLYLRAYASSTASTTVPLPPFPRQTFDAYNQKIGGSMRIGHLLLTWLMGTSGAVIGMRLSRSRGAGAAGSRGLRGRRAILGGAPGVALTGAPPT